MLVIREGCAVPHFRIGKLEIGFGFWDKYRPKNGMWIVRKAKWVKEEPLCNYTRQPASIGWKGKRIGCYISWGNRDV